MVKNIYIGLLVQYRLFLSDFNVTWIFRRDFKNEKKKKKNIQIPNFMKIRPVRTKLSHADRQTDRHNEVNSRFSQFLQMHLKKSNLST